MMGRWFRRAYLLLLLTSAYAAPAKDLPFVVSKAVSDRPEVTANATSGYVLVRTSGPMSIFLMRLPSPEDQAEYDRRRAEALAKEKKKYPGKLSLYQSSLRTYEMLKKGGGAGKEPTKPVEPTEENFVFTPFGLLANAELGPMNRFSKGEKGASIYLQAITPGEYRLYGPVSTVVPGGMCYCMGSVTFTVRAGEVTDLGRMMADEGDIRGSLSRTLQPYGDDMTVDPRLAGWTLKPAEYRAAGKVPNYFGVQVGRINPIDGIISYDRDRILDLTVPPGLDASAEIKGQVANAP